MRILTFLTLATVTCVASPTSPRRPSLPGDIVAIPGSILQLEGRVLPISEFIHVSYSLDPLSLFVRELQTQSELVHTLVPQLPVDSPIKPFLNRLLTRISNHIHAMSPPTHRATRGLFNFVGVVAHELFGIVDDTTMVNRLQEFNERQSSVTTTINAQSEAIKTLQANVMELGHAADTFYKRVRSQIHDAESLARNIIEAMEYMSTFDEISRSAERFQDALLAAAKGEVTMALLSPSDIQSIYLNATSSGSEPLFPPSQINLLYASMTSYVTDVGLSVLIPIKPLVSYTAFSTHPFPIFHNGSYITLHSQSNILIPKSSNALPLISSLALPPQPIQHTCLNPTPGIFICLKPLWPFSSNDSSCEHAITTQRNNIHTACRFDIFSNTHTTHILPLQDVTLFYFFQPINITITCNSTWTKLIHGSYILPHTCGLTSTYLHFPAIKQFHVSFSKSFQFLSPTPLPVHTHNLPPLQELSLKTMTPPPVLTYHPGFIYGYPVGVTLAGVLFLAACTTVCVVYMKRTTKRRTSRLGTQNRRNTDNVNLHRMIQSGV